MVQIATTTTSTSVAWVQIAVRGMATVQMASTRSLAIAMMGGKEPPVIQTLMSVTAKRVRGMAPVQMVTTRSLAIVMQDGKEPPVNQTLMSVQTKRVRGMATVQMASTRTLARAVMDGQGMIVTQTLMSAPLITAGAHPIIVSTKTGIMSATGARM
jgi:hypothetical protein